MSRRTERPYKVDGAGQLAPHSAARCSAPEINGPAVQREFTSLLRETCSPNPSVTVGAAVSNDPRAAAGVSRGRSTEGNEPGKTGRTHNSGRAELGRQTRPSMVWTGSDEADWLSLRQRPSWQRKSAARSVKDCQEPPYADPHVRWCGSREGQPSRRPDLLADVMCSALILSGVLDSTTAGRE